MFSFCTFFVLKFTVSIGNLLFAGAMTFEAKKFRPREVVKHVVQMASTSVAADNKTLQVDADVSEDVPLEVGLDLY